MTRPNTSGEKGDEPPVKSIVTALIVETAQLHERVRNEPTKQQQPPGT